MPDPSLHDLVGDTSLDDAHVLLAVAQAATQHHVQTLLRALTILVYVATVLGVVTWVEVLR